MVSNVFGFVVKLNNEKMEFHKRVGFDSGSAINCFWRFGKLG